MQFSTSPSSSSSSPSTASTSPHVSIGFSPIRGSGPVDIYPHRKATLSPLDMTCAFPSWPKGDCFKSASSSSGTYGGWSGAPSSFISDEDLFPGEISPDSHRRPFLDEAPPPPRTRHLPHPAMLPLAPLYASQKSKKPKPIPRKQKMIDCKPMAPIAESPEASE